MRSALMGLMVFVLAAGIAGAENKEKPAKPPEGFKKERIIKLSGGLYTKMYINAFYKAKSLTANKEQRVELNRVGKIYAKKIMASENMSRKLQITFLKQMEHPPYDSSKLKTLAAEMTDANTKTIDEFIAGMGEIEKIIGPENFAKLAPIKRFDRRSLVQLQRISKDNPLGEEEVKSADPGTEAGSN